MGRAFYRNGQYLKALDYFYQFEQLQTNSLGIYGFNGEKEQRFERTYLEELPHSIRACKNALELLNFSNVAYIQNVGDSINTTANEYFPYVSNDQQLLFYNSSKFDQTQKSALDENLYFSHKNGEWQRGKAVNSLITTPQNEGMSTFTRDGVTMIYTVCQQAGVLADGCDLRQATMQKDSVLLVDELKGEVNSKFWESQAALTCDGNRLFFASNRRGGYGSTDIWTSKRLPDGSWDVPKNLGKNVNTEYDEEAPFITNDGKTLFFSSTGHLGMGEQDIYMSHWNEKGYWEAAINLGPPINTAARELGFFLTSDNQTGYFASNKSGGFGGMDIYKFQMPQQFEVAPTTFVEGLVKDAITQQPIETYVQTNLRGRIKTDQNGRFFFCLPAGESLSMRIQQDDYLPYDKSVSIPAWDNKTLFPISIYLSPKVIPVVTTPPPEVLPDTVLLKTQEPLFYTVYFNFNDFGINPTETKRLDRVFANLDILQFSKAEIVGYADTNGNSDYNVDLSRKRAQNVEKYLVLLGLDTTEKIIIGKGESSQFDTNRLNRRVEIRLE
ncbi:MAG: OmpA family protein [Bacteroidota bacterium]